MVHLKSHATLLPSKQHKMLALQSLKNPELSNSYSSSPGFLHNAFLLIILGVFFPLKLNIYKHILQPKNHILLATIVKNQKGLNFKQWNIV